MGFPPVTLGRLLHLSMPRRWSHSWECPSILSVFVDARTQWSCPRAGVAFMCCHLKAEHSVGRDWGPSSPNLNPAGAVGLCAHSALSLSEGTYRQREDYTQLGKSSKILGCSLYCFSCFLSQMRESCAVLCSVLLLVLQKYLPFFSAFASNYWRCNFVLNEQLSAEP